MSALLWFLAGLGGGLALLAIGYASFRYLVMLERTLCYGRRALYGRKVDRVLERAIADQQLGEIRRLNKAEITAVKQFLSARDGLYRPPYGAQRFHGQPLS
jgi:hypothetical protein